MDKRCFLAGLATVFSMTVAASSSTYKCIYAVAECHPVGYGEVYLDASNKDADFVREQSDSFGDTAFVKFVATQRGSENSSGGLKSGKSFYGGMVYANAFDGYEIVCYTNKVKENMQYLPSECYAVVRGEGESDRTYDFNYSDMGDMVNMELSSRGSDGSSGENGKGRYDLLENESFWPETPDDSIFVIFRKQGARFPRMVENESDIVDVIDEVSVEDEMTIYDMQGRRQNGPQRGLNIVKYANRPARKVMQK